MITVELKLNKDSWTISDLGTILGTVATVLGNHSLDPSSISFDGLTELTINASSDSMTYDQFKTFRTEVETLATNGSITIKKMDYEG